jgi:spermidine synthase
LLARFRIIAPLFLTSGATALLYQVAFGKKLATIYGATAYAVSAVLAAFMGGLAMGSFLGGRWAGKVRRPLMIYGIAEILVGVVCALTPSFFDAVASAYRGLVLRMPDSLAFVTATRAALTAIVVIVPTIAMGITMPMLARAVAGQSAADDAELARRRLSLLYAINTLGGAVGAVVSAYLVLPTLGLTNTMRAAAIINLVIGAVAVHSGRSKASSSVETDAEGASLQTGRESEPAPLLLLLALCSGLFVFAAEVVDTHLLALLIGNSAYAFGLMLAVFLTCLSAGASLAGWIDRRFERSALAVALCVTSLALLATLPVLGRLPNLFLWIGARVSSWAGRELVRAFVAFFALALPTMCMGLTFPLLLRKVAGHQDVGHRVGQLTAINTIGSIAGSLACGYYVLPLLGSERTLQLIAIAFAALGIVSALWARQGVRVAGALGAVALVASLVMPRWDMKLLTNGANVYFSADAPPDALEMIAEDVHGGFTSVARRNDVLTMYTNGKFQGDNGWEVTAQRSFAHFPALFVKGFDRSLVIGLGTGTTLGTIAGYPFDAIEVAEISPAIVSAAKRFFSGPNRGSLDDRRVTMIMNDGRNHLLITDKRYDLITIELTSVWFAGAANLYSREFYELCRARLKDDGVLQQWLQLHHIDRRELAVALRTLRSVFDHVALFVGGNQGIVVASAPPLIASRAKLAELEARPAVKESLAGASLPSLLGKLVISGAELDRFIADSDASGTISTDDNLYLEYATPKGNVMSYATSIEAIKGLLDRYRIGDPMTRHLRD